VSEDEARRRVRQLLLPGDTTLKNRTGGERVARARSRDENALAVAQRRPDALDRH
jgi:hypothetical protein